MIRSTFPKQSCGRRFPPALVPGWRVIAAALLLAFFAFLPVPSVAALETPRQARPAFPSQAAQELVNQSVTNALRRYAGETLKADELALTLVDLNATPAASVSFRGDAEVYPASVIKLFYLVAAHRWLEDGRLKETDELRRAMKDMIVDSSNDATHYIVDLLTGTTSGPELEPGPLQEWFDQRNEVNRYFTKLGYTRINANKKPWCEGPYGRESQAIKLFSPKRNALTTEATARLLSAIVQGEAVTAARSKEMLSLLARDPAGASSDPDDQARGFMAKALPAGARIWSKAGWTTETRHDAACVEFANGSRIVLVIFTTNHGNQRELLPAMARPIFEAFARLRSP